MTYMNSSAAIKAFCGEPGAWYAHLRMLAQRSNGHSSAMNESCLCRSTSGAQYRVCHGYPLERDGGLGPYMLDGGRRMSGVKNAKVVLWKGHCSVHQRFLPEHVSACARSTRGYR